MFKPFYIFLYEEELKALVKAYNLEKFEEEGVIYYSSDKEITTTRYIENKPIGVAK